MALVVDAHHHFWDPSRATYPWMTDALASIRRRFGPEDLRPLLAANGVDRTVLVQTISSLGETREFLATAAANEFIAGVVGWVDLTAPDLAEQLAALRAGPGGAKLVGIRHQVHDEPDPEWLLRRDVRRGLAVQGLLGLITFWVADQALRAGVGGFGGLVFDLDALPVKHPAHPTATRTLTTKRRMR